MRLTKSVTLGQKRTATVRELRVRDVQNVFAQLEELQTVTIQEIVAHRLHELIGLLDDCIEQPKGEDLEDLTFSEIEAIREAFMEINAPFFRVSGLRHLINMTLKSLSPDSPSSTGSAASTPPPPPLSSEATPE